MSQYSGFHQQMDMENNFSCRRKGTSKGYKRHNSYIENDTELPSNFISRNNGYVEKMSREDYETFERKVEDYFEKKFYFKPPIDDWTLPEPNKMFVRDQWKVDHLQRLKVELNNVKSKLDSYNLSDWHKHTRTMNKAGEIQWKLRNHFEPEFLTQAWCKFYENLMSFPLVPPIVINTGHLNSVHLCEAPGAFITSLNHYLKLHNRDIKWNWIATTLNPYYEGNPLSCMINDDRFILQTLEHWYFGKDYTGDLMNVKNMQQLMKETDKMGDVLLVTADGSIDCQEDPGEQESIVSALHYCEAVSALHILAEGGSFLLKMFTMYEQETVCLMYLLCCSFNCVRVCKPATSKEGNSEVYVICLEYKGRKTMAPWLKVLNDYFGPELPKKAMFPLEEIPKNFLDQVYECAKLFKDYQAEVIETNIRVYEEGYRVRGQDRMLKKMKHLIADHFMEKYDMQKLSEPDEVVGKQKLRMTMTLNMDPRAEEGSFKDRRKKATLKPLELLNVLSDELNSIDVKWPFTEDVTSLKFPVVVDGFEIKVGKPVGSVHSSKFCLGRLLKIRNQVHDIARICKTLPSSTNKNCNIPSKPSKESIFTEIFQRLHPKGELKVLNFKESLWSSMQSGRNAEAQIHAFGDIMDAIDDLWREESLILEGYPMLTQFNVGIVYMLCHLFETVEFVKPVKQDFAVIFVRFRNWDQKMQKFLDEVDLTIEKLKDKGGHMTVLSLFPINKLCDLNSISKETEGVSESTDTKEGDRKPKKFEDCVKKFYKWVTEVNHFCVKEQVSDIISSIDCWVDVSHT